MAKKVVRNRVAPDKVRNNATTGNKGGDSWFNLPDGVEIWKPEKAGVYKLDIVPYETKSAHHPDDIEPNSIWYKHDFAVHYNVGPEGKSFVCPTSVGQRCPLCEEMKRLSKKYEENEDMIKSLRPQRFTAYNILNPDDIEKICVFAVSKGKFANLLNKELEEGDDSNLLFFDVTEDGRTLKIRFSKEEWAGKEYLAATRIDFVERAEMDEDEVLGMTACLDNIFIVPPYDKIKAMIEGEVVDKDEDDDDEELPRPPKKEKPAAKKKPRPEPEDDEEEEEEPVKPPKKEKTATKKKGEPEPEEGSSEDEDDDWEF